MSTTTPKQTDEFDVPGWYGLHLERTTVLNTAHIATMDAALAGIQAVVDVLHDRESQRSAGEATHCPTRNMGLPPLTIDPAKVALHADIAPALGGAADWSQITTIDLEKLPEEFRQQRLVFKAAQKAFEQLQDQFKGQRE